MRYPSCCGHYQLGFDQPEGTSEVLSLFTITPARGSTQAPRLTNPCFLISHLQLHSIIIPIIKNCSLVFFFLSSAEGLV